MQDWPLIWRIGLLIAMVALSTVAMIAFRLWDSLDRARAAVPPSEATRLAKLRNLPPPGRAARDASPLETPDPFSPRARPGACLKKGRQMSTALAEQDPLAPNLLPSRTNMTVSTDTPSAGTVRPFGLTRATTLGANDELVTLDGTTYDPARQVSVDTDGRPFVDTPGVIHMGTKSDTKYDNQWFTDKD